MTMTLLTTNTSSGDSTSSFTSKINSTYKLYIFKFIDINPATDAQDFTFQANASGQSGYNEYVTTTYFQAYTFESGGTPALAYETSIDQAQGTSFHPITNGQGNGADESAAGTLWLFNPSNTTYVKHIYSVGVNYYSSDQMYHRFSSGYINSTSDVDAVQFKFDSGNFDGTIKMYGVG